MSTTTRENPMYDDDEIMKRARSVEPHDFDRIAPPAQVWNNIQAELEVEVASQESLARQQSRPWFSSSRLLSIAAATLVMVGVAVAVVAYSNDDPQDFELASAMLTDEGLPVATNETADAAVVCEADQCFVQLELTALPDAGADNLELWVINGDVTDMHSLGNVDTSDGRFPLPEGVTTDGFPIVDISIEPDDGDPTHSGQSVLRGVFEAG